MGDPLDEFLAAPMFPERELTPAEGERLNSVLLGEAPMTEEPSPTTEDDGPPDYGHDDDGPPEHALSGDESERDGGASGSASAGADNNSTGKGKGKKGYGKFGKSKWDNHPTQVPYRKGKDGGKRGPPKRSGGRHATWYRKYYSLKGELSPEKFRQWLEMNPHPSHGIPMGAGKGKGV